MADLQQTVGVFSNEGFNVFSPSALGKTPRPFSVDGEWFFRFNEQFFPLSSPSAAPSLGRTEFLAASFFLSLAPPSQCAGKVKELLLNCIKSKKLHILTIAKIEAGATSNQTIKTVKKIAERLAFRLMI